MQFFASGSLHRRGSGAGVLFGVVVGLLASDALAGDAPCPDAPILAEGATLPDAWRAALEDAKRRTSRAGTLWGCRVERIRVTLDPDGGAQVILVREDGEAVLRRAATPAELAPTVVALVAAEAAGSVPLAPVPEPMPMPDVESTAPITRASADRPRVGVESSVSGRYGAPVRTLWGKGELRALVSYGDWSGGSWARAGQPYVLQRVPARFSEIDGQVGLTIERRIVRRPVEVMAAIEPSIAVVDMGSVDVSEHEYERGVRVDGRVAGVLRVLVPWSRSWNAVLALDAEVSPAGLGDERRVDEAIPAMPIVSIGMSFGVRAVVQ